VTRSGKASYAGAEARSLGPLRRTRWSPGPLIKIGVSVRPCQRRAEVAQQHGYWLRHPVALYHVEPHAFIARESALDRGDARRRHVRPPEAPREAPHLQSASPVWRMRSTAISPSYLGKADLCTAEVQARGRLRHAFINRYEIAKVP
jgi:hypothetical protein